jgi:hypothetical protein
MNAPDGFLTVTRVVSAPCVRDSDARVTVPVPGHACGPEPTVELIREGDAVRAIDITCPCGRRLRVLCEYADLIPQ